MTKAEELAFNCCKNCFKKYGCKLPCNDVLMSLFVDSKKSPHEAQEAMRNARRRIGI